METLLLTWTIAPHKNITWYKSTTLVPKERYNEYIQTIIFYITQSDFAQIVFCENSNACFHNLELVQELCKIYNKTFELLQFCGDTQKVIDLWYWYWDAECMDFAFDHSKLLRNCENFYKISGRYKVSNINIIIKKYIYDSNVFYQASPIWFFTIMTWFIKINKHFYKKHFYNLKYLCKKSKILEVIYWEAIKGNKSFTYMWIYPRFLHLSWRKYMIKVIESKLNYIWLAYFNTIIRKFILIHK